MFNKIRQSKLMFWSVEALVIVALIIGLSNISFVFAPVATFFLDPFDSHFGRRISVLSFQSVGQTLR